MPIPSSSFTRSKWLAFFAELTAKVTHHSVLVGIEGCETLKRLLISHVSIAAFLQEGELLQSLLNAFVGGVRSGRGASATSTTTTAITAATDAAGGRPSATLTEELTAVQLETLSIFVDMMVAMYADAVDPYASLLVLARAGVLVEGLLEVLPRAPAWLFGPITSVLGALLSLPLGQDPPPALLKDIARVPSVALRRHIAELAELVYGQGMLLQDAADTLAAVTAMTTGPSRFAALRLLRLATQQLRTHHLRNRIKGGIGHASEAEYETSITHEAYGAGLNHSIRPRSSEAANRSDVDATSVTVLSDFDATITGAPAGRGDGAAATVSSSSPREGKDADRTSGAGGDTAANKADASDANPDGSGRNTHRAPTPRAAKVSLEDGSAHIDQKPSDIVYSVPPELACAALDAMAQCRSHEAFFAALSDLWSITVADAGLLATVLDTRAFKGMSRFLIAPPATRQDRLLFTALLRWLGHVLSAHVVPQPTREVLASIVGSSLIPMLHADLRARDTKDSMNAPGSDISDISGSGGATARKTINATDANTRAAAATAIVASIADTRRREAAALVEVSSKSLVVLSFLLTVTPICDARDVVNWVQVGDLFNPLLRSLIHVESVKSVMIDTPSNIDGALSDEVYLDNALRMVRTDRNTLAMLSCKLLASLLWTHARALRELLTVESRSLVERAVPLLVAIVTHNPTVATAVSDGTVSALFYTPGASSCEGNHGRLSTSAANGSRSEDGANSGSRMRSSRYTTLGECAAVALDGMLSFHRFARLRCVHVMEILPSLPALSRSTRHSIHAPLRACVYRALVHLCVSPADVMNVVEELPSVMNAAITSVLAYQQQGSNGYMEGGATHWECAAAAEWLGAVIRITGDCGDAAAELPLALVQTTLTLRLLEIVGTTSLNYASAALVGLLTALSEQQERLVKHALNNDDNGSYADAVSSVTLPARALAPQGRRSLVLWTQLAQRATEANERLARLSRHPLWTAATETATAVGAARKSDAHVSSLSVDGDNHAHGEADSQRAPMVSRRTATDALPRALTVAEHMAVQYMYTANVLYGLVRLLRESPAYRADLPHTTIYGLLAGALSVPSPAGILSMLATRFAVHVDEHPTLTRAYGALIQWTCELAPVWFALPTNHRTNLTSRGRSVRSDRDDSDDADDALSPMRSAHEYPPLPTSMLMDAARVMADATLPPRTRCHVPLLISSLLILPDPRSSVLHSESGYRKLGSRGTGDGIRGREEEDAVSPEDEGEEEGGAAGLDRDSRTAIGQSIAPAAAALFDASCELKRTTCVIGMQCRLLTTFRGANHAARTSSWFLARVKDLATLTRLLVKNGGTLDAVDTESLLVHLSLVTSVVGYRRCPSLSRDVRQSICASIAEGVRYAHTRLASLRALRALAVSAEGRRCLLHEIATSGEPLARTCFGRLLAVALGLSTVWDAPELTSSRHSPRSRGDARHRREANDGNAHQQTATTTTTTSERAAQREVEGQFALDTVTAVCGHGGHPFVAALMKHRGLEVVERLLLTSQGGRHTDCRSRATASTAPAGAAAFLRLLRLVAALSLDADAQRAIFQRPAVVTTLVDTAGSADAAGTLALLVLRNGCAHPSLKTVICQDTRILLTLKAALMRLTCVEPLVIGAADAAPSVAAAASGASPPLSPSASPSSAPTGRRGALHRTTSALRRDLADSRNASLVDWATHAARHNIQEQLRAVTPPSSTRRVSPTLSIPPPPPQQRGKHGAQTGTQWSSRVPTVTEADPLSLAKRQEMAVTALWSLAHNHERGKLYVRRLLQEAPPISLASLLSSSSGTGTVATRRGDEERFLAKSGDADGFSTGGAAMVQRGQLHHHQQTQQYGNRAGGGGALEVAPDTLRGGELLSQGEADPRREQLVKGVRALAALAEDAGVW